MTTPSTTIATKTGAALTAALLATVPVPALALTTEGVTLTILRAPETPAVLAVPREAVAGERFEAGPSETVEVLFADGTSVVLAPGSALTVAAFAYDPEARTGRLRLRLERGLARIAGGALNNTSPIVVETPSATVELDNATAFVEVRPDGATRASLVLGRRLTLTSGGETKTLDRPGFELVALAADQPPSDPVRQEPGAARADAEALHAGGAVVAFTVNGDVDERVDEVALVEPAAGPEEPTPEEGGDVATNVRGEVADQGSRFNPAPPPAAGAGAVAGAESFAPNILGIANLTQEQPSIGATPAPVAIEGGRRSPLSTNIIFLAEELFSQTIVTDASGTAGSNPLQVRDVEAGGSTDLTYFFDSSFGAGGFEPIIASLLELSAGDEPRFEGPFLLNIPLIEGSGGSRKLVPGSVRSRVQEGEKFGGIETGTVFGVSNAADAPLINTFVKMIQSGFTLIQREQRNEFFDTIDIIESIERSKDHFLVVQVRPILTAEESRQALREEFQRLLEDSLRGDSISLREDANKLVLRSFDVEVEPGQNEDDLAEALASTLIVGPNTFQDRINDLAILSDDQKQRALAQAGRNEQFLFASGAVDGELDTTRRVDTFFISPGLDGFAADGEPPANATVASQVRAFLRNATAFREADGTGGLPLADTGLLVIGTPAESRQSDVAGGSDVQTGVLHADFGIENTESGQRSTISVTIGEVRYGVGEDIPGVDDADADNEVVLKARTVGSSQQEVQGSVLASTDLFNTAAGGGNPAITANGDDPIPGRAGYFVIENFDPDRPNETGGVERPVDTGQGEAAGPDRFAILRLATGIKSEDMSLTEAEQQRTTLQGYAAGLAELQTLDGTGQINQTLSVDGVSTGNRPDGFLLTLDPTTNRVLAVLGANDPDSALILGGLMGEASRGASAYVDADRFGARTVAGQGADVAMVSGELLRGAANAEGSNANADTKAFLNAVPEYQHLKWGFFFGDLDPVGADDNLRRHVHLGTWVAGKALVDPSRLPTRGRASYEGHAIGNVVNSGALYSAVGTYRNTWNFGSRAGLTTLDFDGANMTGFTIQQGNRPVFEGALSGGGRTAGIAGGFVQGAEAPGVPPAGQMGQFTVNGPNYGAAGTFGAEKQ